MTLTALLPTLRGSIPDPITRDRWPELTVPGLRDVVVSGVSLVRLVELCGTPCVHVAAAVLPGTGGRPSDRELASVVVARVLAVSAGHVELDATLRGVPAELSELRMLGRVSTAHTRSFVLDGGSAAAVLPGDLRAGDLVAVPCEGALRRRDVIAPRR